jgi:hypothetical protein
MKEENLNNYQQYLLYKTPDGKVHFEVFLHNETIWLTQQKLAELFGVDRSVITKHLSNIFKDKELEKDSVCAKIAHTAKDGKTYNTNFYNLDAIISVGYRVNSKQATHFRMWANQVLKEYIIKGFAMDDERLKNPNNPFGKDYFEEQLARIRDIRSSERRFYQKITDIYAQCSADHSKDEEITKQFFATVQNKLHWAISQQTAAEIIADRANSKKDNMGLTNWKNSPEGSIRKQDVSVAKNYLNKEELDNLNHIVTMYLDYAENQARKGIVMHMNDWVNKLNAFLEFNGEEILHHKGKVSHKIAKELAETEYEKFRTLQDRNLISDFDEEVNKMLNKKSDK